jgi:hypothetical protein
VIFEASRSKCEWFLLNKNLRKHVREEKQQETELEGERRASDIKRSLLGQLKEK